MSDADSWRRVVEAGCYSYECNIHHHYAWELRYQMLNNAPTVVIIFTMSVVLQLPAIISLVWG